MIKAGSDENLGCNMSQVASRWTRGMCWVLILAMNTSTSWTGDPRLEDKIWQERNATRGDLQCKCLAIDCWVLLRDWPTVTLSLSICPPCFFIHACTSFTRDGSCYLYYIDLNLLLYYLGSRSYRRPLAVAAELQQRAAGRGGGYLRRCWLFLGWWLWSWGCDWCSYAGVVGHLCNGCKEFGIWSSYYIIT